MTDPLDVPEGIIAYLGAQLGIDRECLPRYLERRETRMEHSLEIKTRLGYKDFDEQPGGLFVLAKLDDRAIELARTANVLVIPGDWGRTPGWCRFCFSSKLEKFQKGIQQLAKFLSE